MQLTFNQINFQSINKANQIWLTTSQLAEALEYSDVRGITNIYNRKADEFSDGMTTLIDNPQMKNAKIRIFSLRGCHLIAMFARTKIAKEFRQWVLDILDKEVGEPVQVEPKLTDNQAYQIQKAIKQKCLNNKVHYQTIYHALYDEFGVKSYKDILASEFERALAFIESFEFAVNLDLAFIHDVLRNSAHQNKKARQELDQIIDVTKHLIYHIEALQVRLGISERCVHALHQRLV